MIDYTKYYIQYSNNRLKISPLYLHYELSFTMFLCLLFSVSGFIITVVFILLRDFNDLQVFLILICLVMLFKMGLLIF